MKQDNDNPNSKITASQGVRLLNFLLNGGSITSLSALDEFGSLNLSGRIFEIKAQGYEIASEWIKTSTGKRVKRYYLPAYVLNQHKSREEAQRTKQGHLFK